MKGIIFNLLEDAVTQEHSEETWEDLLDAAGLDGAYTSLGSYPDDQLIALVNAAAAALGQSSAAILRWFGIRSIPLLAEKYPGFFDKHPTTRPFLLTINAIIHPEVRKLYPGAQVPDFHLDASSNEVLVMGYDSSRKLCALAEGFIEGAAMHYREVARIHHSICMHRGDPSCRLELSFTRESA